MRIKDFDYIIPPYHFIECYDINHEIIYRGHFINTPPKIRRQEINTLTSSMERDCLLFILDYPRIEEIQEIELFQ